MAGPDASDAAPPGTAEYRRRAEERAAASPAGIGAAAVYSGYQNGEHVWECIVTDGGEWHYIRVLGSELGPYPDLSSDDIERGIERFAATLPSGNRFRQLLGANPLHVDPRGKVAD